MLITLYDPGEVADSADDVFHGTVLRPTSRRTIDDTPSDRYLVRVEHTFKGHLSGTVTVTQPAGEPALKAGEKYVFTTAAALRHPPRPPPHDSTHPPKHPSLATNRPWPSSGSTPSTTRSTSPPTRRQRPDRQTLTHDGVSEVVIGDSGCMLLPLTHAKTELIDVVRITDPARHLSSKDLTGDTASILEGDQARQTVSLIADLPGSELYRCFLPGWGIRAHNSTDQLFEIAFCFRCHMARIWGPDLPVEEQGQTFDAESPAALELLCQFHSCLRD
ncbi:hypothetical protein [Streptomyces albidochromogenes]|uniref:Hedgehog/Intein (Hint) domain-containing protein n=1 Tax=Streptomyces albidochromogenes TaxID=329524 RepID=A0ABW6FH77_9ACTN